MSIQNQNITKQNIIEEINKLAIDPEKTLLDLFNESFSKVKDEQLITYKTTIIDPFLTISKPTETKPYNLDNLYDWYLTKNTTFRETGQTIRAADPKVPEFKTILALILKDLMLLLVSNTFPIADENDTDPSGFERCCKYIKTLSGTHFTNLENKEEKHKIIYEVLIKLKNIIENGYKYLEIIELIIDYYKLFNFGHLNEEFVPEKNVRKNTVYENVIDSQCLEYINILRNLSDTYFMIYPSFSFVNYTKILYFLQAPVLILKMSNIREFTDKVWMSPITQIWHDIAFHSRITHCLKSYETNLEEMPLDLQKQTINLYRNIDGLYDNVFRRKFEIIKEYINVNYKKLDSDDLTLSIPERIKYYIAYVLFSFLHEGDYNDEILIAKCTVLHINNLEKSLKKLLDKGPETKESVIFKNKKITVASIKDRIIKNFLAEFQNDKEFKRFTLIENKDNNYTFNNNNDINIYQIKLAKRKALIEKSYDKFKEEIDKMFTELESLNTQLGGYKRKSINKLTKIQKKNTKENKSYKSKGTKNHRKNITKKYSNGIH
jgi:hypothetical protein